MRDAMPADFVKDVELKRKELQPLRSRLCHLKRVMLKSQSTERQAQCDEEMSSLETRIATLEVDIARVFQVAAKREVDAAEAAGSEIDIALDAAASAVQTAKEQRLTQRQNHDKLQAIVEAPKANEDGAVVEEAPEANENGAVGEEAPEANEDGAVVEDAPEANEDGTEVAASVHNDPSSESSSMEEDVPAAGVAPVAQVAPAENEVAPVAHVATEENAECWDIEDLRLEFIKRRRLYAPLAHENINGCREITAKVQDESMRIVRGTRMDIEEMYTTFKAATSASLNKHRVVEHVLAMSQLLMVCSSQLEKSNLDEEHMEEWQECHELCVGYLTDMSLFLASRC